MDSSQLTTGLHFAALPSLERFTSPANQSVGPLGGPLRGPQSAAQQIASRNSIGNAIESPGTLSSVGEDFEAVFVSLMLKQMRSSMTEDGLFGGDSSDAYGGIFDLYLGKHIAASQPLGIGEMVRSYTERAVNS